MFIIVDIFIYAVFYAIFLNKILGIKEMTDYFNIAGYWFFNGNNNLFVPLIVSFLLQIISFVTLVYIFRDKGQVVIDYEKQVS